MNAAQKRAMQQGRERYQRERQARAIARVEAFRAWLAGGSVLRAIPEIPSDADYAASRAWEGRKS
jgi:hypothetical protein